MSGNTKMTLAIVLGVVGLLIGGLGAITAFNAKKAVDSETKSSGEIQALVDQQFGQAQQRQDEMEATQKSDAEKFVAQLTKDEKSLLGKINRGQRRLSRLNRQVKRLKRQVNSLSNRDKQLANELAQEENERVADNAALNQRINKTNNQVQSLQRQVSKLQGLVGQ